MTPEQLVEALQKAIGPNLKGVVLYGSAVVGDFVPGVSGHDVLIIAEQLGASELTTLSAPLMRWEHAGNPLPQLFTPQELANSTDVFPIELLDMRQSRRVLFGPDPLGGLKIDMHDYRVQLERELKTRLLLLRRRSLACLGDEERVAGLMVASISTFLVLLRAVLRLYNDSAPMEKVNALDQLARHMKFDPQPFHAVLDLKRRQVRPADGEMASLFGQYLTSIEQVVQNVDRHLHPSTEMSNHLATENSHE